MATDVKVPALGELITEGTLAPVAEEAGRSGRRGRADRQPRDRQGVGRGALAGRRHAERAAVPGRRHGRGRRGHRADRRSWSGCCCCAGCRASHGQGQTESPARQVNPPGAGENPALREDHDSAADHADLTLSPAVRRAVLEHHVDPSKIHGTGKDGRLTKDDVLAAAKAKDGGPAHEPEAKAPALRRSARSRSAGACLAAAAAGRAPRRAGQDDPACARPSPRASRKRRTRRRCSPPSTTST